MDARSPSPRLVLGSTSRYRRELLERLHLPFLCEAPEVDETPLRGEAPAALAERLARAKARAVAGRHPSAVVIGADQVAELDGVPLGKPGGRDAALAQLRALSGRTAVFHNGLAVLHLESGFERVVRVPVTVRFRTLETREIDAYLSLEQPYDCAGSAKSEGLGIVLLEAVVTDDPTALVGLPLIATARLLREAGIDPLAGPA